jgi:glycosyltransferase involved in cell wall biosynthesis
MNISIIIPCYRGSFYIKDCIESCLSLEDRDYEIIVVDDGSPDNSKQIVDGMIAMNPQIRLICHETNLGVASAFNTGFNAAVGKYLVRLAQDDLIKPGALRALSEHLDKNPTVDMVYADMELIDSNGEVIGFFEAGKAEEVLKVSARIGLCWMFRREVWDAGYRFDSAFDQVEDFEFWLRASREFHVAKYEGLPLLQFRQHREMGTKKYAAKMEVLTANLLALHTDSPTKGRQFKAEGYLNASYIHRQTGSKRQALIWAFKAWMYAPFSWRCNKNIFGAVFKL